MADLYDVHNARFQQPTDDDLDQFMTEHFAPQGEPEHDPTNPAHVTRELMKPFPQSALYQRQKFTYVQYQQVIRRLIYATGSNFSTEVRDLRVLPWAASGKGHEQALVMATVTLIIPVLQSSRTHTGVQVATVGFGEDMWKGAISDGLKKAAQQFGVAIDLAGADGEDTAPEPSRGHSTWEHEMGTPGPSSAPQPAHQPAGNRQFAPAQPGTGGPATKPQKGRLWHMSGKDDTVVAAWAAEYGETLETLTKGTASILMDTKGGE